MLVSSVCYIDTQALKVILLKWTTAHKCGVSSIVLSLSELLNISVPLIPAVETESYLQLIPTDDPINWV